MASKLGWIRDCWSLFVSNLTSSMTNRDLYALFREAGPVFNEFLPKDEHSGVSRGFGLVPYKTEWDVNRAIQWLNGRLLGGRRISVQKAKHIDRNVRNPVRVAPTKGKESLSLAVLNNHTKCDVQTWVEEEGNLKVVKLASSLVTSLKKQVCNLFVATIRRFDVSEREIQTWLFKEKEIDVKVKRLRSMLFWIQPLSLEGYSRMLELWSIPFDPFPKDR